MHIFVTVIALAIFSVGIFLSQKDLLDKKSNLAPPNREVLSEDSHPEENNEVKIENEITVFSETPTPETPTPTKIQATGEIFAYRYPGAEIAASSANSLTLRSFDDAEAITNWYKDKIENENMSVESFVETSANERVSNELVGADGQKEIRVEIKKDSSASSVEITVSLTT